MASNNRTADNAEQKAHLPVRKPRTLLVEDEYPALLRRRDLLRMKDLHVIEATSKAEALDRLRNIGFRIDVVMTDLNLTPNSDTIEGVDVAQAVSDHWGQSVPIYAYSGKRRVLEDDRRRLFKDVVLKSDTSRRVREVFDQASEDAFRHFNSSVQRAETLLTRLNASAERLSPPEVGLIRDLVAGAAPLAQLATTIPDSVGFLPLSEHFVGVAYGITFREVPSQRTYATVIGHEYLYSYGESEAEAVSALEDVVTGFAALVLRREEAGIDEIDEAVGSSRRMRKLFLALRAREEELRINGTAAE